MNTRISRPGERRTPRSVRGSVLIIVMVTLVFAAFALIAFMDKATNDLLVDHREAANRRLRMEAYSALETTLAVLEDFREVGKGLHSPAEGWSDPLAFAGYVPAEDRTIEVAFEDESGKISLPHADAQVLVKLFQSWDVAQPDAEMLADALLGWMKKDHVYSTAISPDYEQGSIPYQPPARPLRSYAELAAIDKVREFFYDANGHPNDNWRRFVASVSLYDFAKTNLNGAKPESLSAIGQYDEMQQKTISDYLAGRGSYQSQGQSYFTDAAQAQALAGQGGNAGAFGTTISALRVVITVHEGRTQFRLAAVVTYNNGAKVVQETATSQKSQTSASTAKLATDQKAAPDATKASTRQTTTPTTGSGTAAQASGTQTLRYPFTLLEIRENDEIPATPSAPAADSSF